MISIFAPHPDYRITIRLPNGEWGNFERLESSMQLLRSMNGTTTVTHKRVLPNARAYELSLVLTRKKSIEFIGFFELFGAELMKIILHDATVKIGYMRINPMELEVMKRALVGSSVEEVNTRFDFETIQ